MLYTLCLIKFCFTRFNSLTTFLHDCPHLFSGRELSGARDVWTFENFFRTLTTIKSYDYLIIQLLIIS